MPKIYFLIGLLFIIFQSAQPQKQDNKKALTESFIFQRIDSLEKADLPQSAFKLTDDLYKKALSQRSTSLFVKTLVLRMKYRDAITEESLVVFIEEMENQAPKTWEPAKQIMHTMLAELYQWYYIQNRWKLLEQRQVDSESNDIREMSASELSGKAIEHYRLSLSNVSLLQNEQLDQYKDIIEKESGKFNLRPTLFDLLSVRAVEAMLSDALFQEPVTGHSIFENPAILGDINQFMTLSLTDYNKSDAVTSGLNSLYDWLAFRNKTHEPEPLFDADLTRLRLLSNFYSGDNMETLYENALTNLAAKSRKTSVFSDVLFTKALFLQQLSNSKPQKDDNRNYLKEALNLAQQGVDAWPESEGAALCRDLIQRITRPYVHLRTEKYNGIGERFAYRVDYNNVKRIYVSLFQVKPFEEEAKQNETTEEAVLKQIENLKPIRTEIKTVPDFEDYLNHSAEFDLQIPNEPGMYCLMASLTPFNSDVKKMEIYSLKVFQITNLTVLHKSDNEGFLDVSVLHRLTGDPLKDVTLSIFEYEWNNPERKKIQTFKTDENGRAHIGFSKDNNHKQIEAILGKDRYQTEQLYTYRTNNKGEYYQTRLFLFTDRQIYRPGQIVWFKGIFMDTNGKEARVLKKITITISLRDANGQELSSQTLLTNDYGSINGKFTIPSNVLTGNFYLQTYHGNHYFNVENYKRPRFEVVMEPFNQIVVLGDEVKTFGKATDMTGAPLQGASVSWRVTREVNFRRNWGYQNPVSIASGTSTTGNNGEFEILFTAVPSSKKTGQFPENFIIDIDVTDVNGETRSQNQTISIARNAIIPSLTLPKTGFIIPVKELPVTFILENHSGENVKGKVSYTISRLLVPQKLLPQRLWNRPDTVLWKGDIYSNYGPEQEEWQNWPDIEVIKTGDTEVNGQISENISFEGNLPTGVYKIQIKTPDKTGEMQKAESLFYVSGNDGQSFNPGDGLLMTVSETEIIPGKRIEISLASAFKQGRIVLLASHENRILLERNIPVSQLSEQIVIPLTKAMVGIVDIQALLVQNNRIYIQNSRIQITNPASKLNIKLQSFRDKVTPGSEETWRIKVTDGNENTPQAELLALMYDSSLDYFAPNQINMNPFNPRYGFSQWQHNDFHEGFGWDRNLIWYKSVQTTPYPSLNWFGYNNGLRFRGGFRNKSPMLLKGAMVSESMDIVDDDLSIADAESYDVIPMTRQEEQVPPPPHSQSATDLVRRQLQETAFFLPTLQTDVNGEIQFNFTMPESITKWRFMALAHKQDGASGTMETVITSSREIMVIPNLPRIVRQGDELILSTKIINTTDSALTGTARLTIKDAVSGKEVIGLETAPVNWSANANSNTKAEWSVKIPSEIKGLIIRVSAAAGHFQDGEEHLIPVLPVKMVITETMPIALSGKGKHNVKMESLMNSKDKEHQGFTFTYTQNAAWEMLGVLPWLIEQPYKNTDQVFNRYFAISVARQIFKDNPQIERVLKSWAAALPGDEDALLSALEKNPELKNTLLAATPWLTEAKNDTERRRRLASLVTEGFLDIELSTALSQLKNLQMNNGAWPWYNGMQPSEFVTSDILSGFGYLKKMGVDMERDVELSTNRAVRWLQNQLILSRDNALKNIKTTENDSVITPNRTIIKNLYALSFFTSKEPSDAEKFWIEKTQKHYQPDDVNGQAMVALVLSRYGYISEAQKLLLSIKEKAIKGERNEWFYKIVEGPYWYQAPVERQVIVLETIRELQPLNNMIAGMEDWLISQKRTQNWSTTRATVAAVYSLVTSQRKLFENQAPDQIKVGGQKLVPSKTVSGSGFFSQSWDKDKVKPALGNVEIKKNAASPSWATMHWSYTQEEAKVQKGGFMDVNKAIFKRVLNKGVEEWYPVTDSVILFTGDRLMVRLLIEASQVLDFVHVNDKRASVMEPLDVFSGYVWKSGLGYYASVTDAGADFFIDHLPKGKYTISYELVVSHKGIATCGPAVVQCFYAPEFSGHSSGLTFSTK